MYTFKFVYNDQKYPVQEFDNIIRAEYGKTVVEENEILSHKFPTNFDIYLFSKSSSYAVSKKNVKFISVTKEN